MGRLKMMNPKLKRAINNGSYSSLTPNVLQQSHKKFEKRICKQTTLPKMYRMMLTSKTHFTFLPSVCSTSPVKVETLVLKEDASNKNMLNREIPAQTVMNITPRIMPEFFAFASYIIMIYKEMLAVQNPLRSSSMP
jgi:hypothetical protein